jgi:hypothetical protein
MSCKYIPPYHFLDIVVVEISIESSYFITRMTKYLLIGMIKIHKAYLNIYKNSMINSNQHQSREYHVNIMEIA